MTTDSTIVGQLMAMNGHIGELRAHVERIPAIERKIDDMRDSVRREIDEHRRDCKSKPSIAPLRLDKAWVRWIVYAGILIGSAVAGGGLVYARVYLGHLDPPSQASGK